MELGIFIPSILLYFTSTLYIMTYPERLFNKDGRYVLRFIEWYEYPLAIIMLPIGYLVSVQLNRIKVRQEKRDKLKKLLLGETNEYS